MDKGRQVERLDRPGFRWAAALAATKVQTRRAGHPVKVRRVQDLYAYESPNGIIPLPTVNSHLTPDTMRADTLDIFCHAYQPKPGDTVLDIGAGIGEEAITLSRLVGPTGRVVAVEAHPETYRQLELTVQLNGLGNVRTVQAAVADKPGEVTIDDGATVGAKIGSGTIRVTATTVDDLAADLDRIDLLKMNIEGAEQLALQGMTDTLGKVRHAVISCHDFVLEPGFGGGDPTWFATYDTVTAFLRDRGWKMSAPRRADDPRPWVRYYVYAEPAA